MDMDLRPPSRPTPSTDITPPPPAPSLPSADEAIPPPTLSPDDPSMGMGSAPVEPPKHGSGNMKRGKGRTFLKILLVLLLIGGVGYGVYYWQNQQVKEANQKAAAAQAQVVALQKENDDLKANSTEAAEVSTDDQVIAAATDQCQAAVDPTTKKALVFTISTQGAEKKKVLYSSDKKFAKVTGVCATSDKGETETYYIKYSGSTWQVIYVGTAAPDKDVTDAYAIPTTFS